MGKSMKCIGICLAIAAAVWLWMLAVDKKTLQEELIRLHIVAASDSDEDQAMKLRVRDAVVTSLQAELKNVTDKKQAEQYLRAHLPEIENLANRVLEVYGSSDEAHATLQPEEFTTRYYDTFALPAGIYESLRITIGAGEGQNWWCVAFPALCLGATTDAFTETAQCAGFPDTLTETLTGEPCEVRFFILDLWGSVENFLHKG